jgi:aldose 1-epimerase
MRPDAKGKATETQRHRGTLDLGGGLFTIHQDLAVTIPNDEIVFTARSCSLERRSRFKIKFFSVPLCLCGFLLSVLVHGAAQPIPAQTPIEVVELKDPRTATTVSIVPSVGNVAFSMKVNGQELLYWPFESVAAFKTKPTLSGIPLLAPFANRLDETAFYANGTRYAFDLTLGNVRSPIPIHGFVTSTDRWQLIEQKTDATAAWATSRLDFSSEPNWMRQWPFAHTIEVTHRIERGVLEVRTRITNRSADPMPLAIGFHPYFQLTDSPRDEWTIAVGARQHWLLSGAKLPTGETEPIERLFQNPQAVSLADHDLDDVFSDLGRDATGRATLTVRGRQQAIDIVFGPNYRAAVIYAPRGRNFICVEPMVGITNALNLAHKGVYRELQNVARGESWQESFWIAPRGF